MSYPYSTFPQQYQSVGPFYIAPNVTGPFNQLTGGVVFAAGSLLQNTRLFDNTFGLVPMKYLGVRSGLSDNNPKQGNDGSLSCQKAFSAGTFGIMTQNKYVLLTFCNQLAGVTNTLLNSTGSSYRKSKNSNIGWVNSQRISSNGGWYYDNGLPINLQYARDQIKTETYPGTYSQPGRLSFLSNGSKIVTVQSYAGRND